MIHITQVNHSGKEKYNDLINYIQKTHHSDDILTWEYNTNREVLFKNKNL
jgi:hypothetical protein